MYNTDDSDDLIITLVGLGYVGLPLLIALSRHFDVQGYDINSKLIQELQCGHDRTQELEIEEIYQLKKIKISDNLSSLRDSNCFIVTVPTPVGIDKRPDLSILESATNDIAKNLHKGGVVIFESTVYPGVTENFCVPILASGSGLKFNEEFTVGYSPERINPGDKHNKLNSIPKIISASDEKTLCVLDHIYSQIINAKLFSAANIKVAETAKLLENSQRDTNIALVNEFSRLCRKVDIEMTHVLEAASTKWNFHRYEPGLVGGHCIGVDPYYFVEALEKSKINSEIVLAARQVNEDQSAFYASIIREELDASNVPLLGARGLILGLTFKEDCPDFRNSKSFDVCHHLSEMGVSIDVYDPYSEDSSYEMPNTNTILFNNNQKYDFIALLVAHTSLLGMVPKIVDHHLTSQGLIFDFKSKLQPVLDRRVVRL
jgi:UDP-N-acetyl-D-glucosamine/UDP-N-acetyl-D-galactosamine dehydrogenase